MQILNVDLWMTRIRCTQTFTLKKVAPDMEKHFPIEYRKIFCSEGAVGLVAHLKKTERLDLAHAWAKVKFFFNDFKNNQTRFSESPNLTRKVKILKRARSGKTKESFVRVEVKSTQTSNKNAKNLHSNLDTSNKGNLEVPKCKAWVASNQTMAEKCECSV